MYLALLYLYIFDIHMTMTWYSNQYLIVMCCHIVLYSVHYIYIWIYIYISHYITSYHIHHTDQIVFESMLQILDSKVNEPTWASLKSTDGLSMPSGPCPVNAGYHVTVFEDKTVTGVPDFHCFVKSGRCETMKAHKRLVCSKSLIIWESGISNFASMERMRRVRKLVLVGWRMLRRGRFFSWKIW